MDRVDMLLEPVRVFLVQVGQFLPKLALAIVVLIAGWMLAKVARFAVVKALRAINFNVLTERAGMDGFLRQGGVESDTTEIFGVLTYWLVILAALIIGIFIYRELNGRQTVHILRDSVSQTASVMLIVASSAVLGWFLTSEQVPQKFAQMILATTDNKILILMFLNIFFLVAGMFLHSAAAIILIVPIVLPLVRQIGVDPIHFGIIVTINLGVGQQTPPVATVLFTTAAIARISFWEVFKMGWPFTLVLVLVTVLVTYVPWISLGPVSWINW